MGDSLRQLSQASFCFQYHCTSCEPGCCMKLFVLMFSLFFLCSCFQKKKQRELKEKWARWTACLQGQPITIIRFGQQPVHYSALYTIADIAALLFSMSSYSGVGSRINKAVFSNPPTHIMQPLFKLAI